MRLDRNDGNRYVPRSKVAWDQGGGRGEQRRQQTLRGETRLHEPSTDEPLVVLLIDELAALTGYVGPGDQTADRERPLGPRTRPHHSKRSLTQ